MSKLSRRGRKASAKTVRANQANKPNRGRPAQGAAARGRRARPRYDGERRELRVGDTLVKRFAQKSDAQEMILLTFQEVRWRRDIEDPLTGKAGQGAKERLRTAVANLNRRQRVPLLRFRVLRQGTAVAWEYRA